MSSQTEDSDRELKPGPPSNLLQAGEKKVSAGEEAAELRGELDKDGQRAENGRIGAE